MSHSNDRRGRLVPAIRTRWAASIGELSRREAALWTLALATFWLDIGVTTVGLDRGLVESNPIAVASMAAIGPVAGLVALKGGSLAVGVGGWLALPARSQWIVPALLSVPWGGAVCLNVARLVGLL
ncbi:hypothetical protein [Halegenticoccus tardaugens]|uniref:hypothetical protein n=1 Tax=Halegenticoccus tardaugens TaxID=2071624 RepID=UPI00100ACC59|nr:hypothetical protein [Halegenticoccus tardaugens]